jgi:hypothetical protein
MFPNRPIVPVSSFRRFGGKALKDLPRVSAYGVDVPAGSKWLKICENLTRFCWF